MYVVYQKYILFLKYDFQNFSKSQPTPKGLGGHGGCIQNFFWKFSKIFLSPTPAQKFFLPVGATNFCLSGRPNWSPVKFGRGDQTGRLSKWSPVGATKLVACQIWSPRPDRQKFDRQTPVYPPWWFVRNVPRLVAVRFHYPSEINLCVWT